MKKLTTFVLSALALITLAGCQNSNSTIADCSKLGTEWTLFQNEDAPISLCYKKEWGEPQYKNKDAREGVQEGNVKYISFTKGDALVSIKSEDYKLLGDHGGGGDTCLVDDEFIMEPCHEESENLKINGHGAEKIFKKTISPYKTGEKYPELETLEYIISDILEDDFYTIKTSLTRGEGFGELTLSDNDKKDLQTLAESLVF